ncbi:DUF2505 domain-containing protein [Micrococcales bacterium 31B]|nr:DUF2505 domain-containing protein [Micrococcales bacterium 31B]
MQISAVIDYPAAVADVVAMLSDPKYCTLKCERTGATVFNTDVQGSVDGEMTITTTRNVPPSQIPTAASKFVGTKLEVRDVVVLGAPDAEGNRTGTMNVTVMGFPCTLTATANLAGTGAATSQMNMTGDVVAKIPLVGKTLEKAAASAIQKIINVEKKLAQQYLSGELA